MDHAESLPQAEVIECVDSVVIAENCSSVTVYYNDGKCVMLTPVLVQSKSGCLPRLEKSYGGRIEDYRPKKENQGG